MNGWTKLHEKAAESVNLSELLDDEPEAFALWMLMLAKAGVWGRFPGHPKLLKARVAPMSERLSASRIAELLPILRERAFVTAYVGDAGEPLLFNTNHFAYNGKQAWHRLGRPEFPPPPDFEPPADLREYLSEVAAGKFRGKKFAEECEKFGVVIDQSETTPTEHSQGVVTDHSQGIVSADAALQTLDVRRETTEHTQQQNDVVPAEPSAPTPPSPAELRKQARTDMLASKAALLDSIPVADRELIAGYIENAAAENTRHTITLSREVSETRALVELRETLGVEAWCYGLQQANAHRAPNLNYVRKAASNYRPGAGGPPAPQGRFITRPDGVRIYERDWSYDDRQWVDACTAAGTWDTENGIGTEYELRDGKPVLRTRTA